MTKEQSRSITKRAIRDGLIARLPCEVCGQEPTHAHHEDYERPLDVVFLCPYHHSLRHQGRTVDWMTETWLALQAAKAMRLLESEREAVSDTGEPSRSANPLVWWLAFRVVDGGRRWRMVL